MSKVSIIIVSYNVKKFLQLCLNSVFSSNSDIEVIVVDNHSIDGTTDMIHSDYPEVRFYPQEENLGFGKACNIGLKEATGEYILFLNPDTVIQEDTIPSCLEFYQNADNPGIVGVKMVDGSGNYLPESKRGFPDMMSSFWKMSGISNLLPKSRFFNQYYLGHLPRDKDNEVDILCGAFMFVEKKVLDAVGSFDESFFMYGEDIDLSYRVQSAGFKNYYLASSTIIHYKGQSTKKEDLRYVNHFYTAMAIFSNKHVSGGKGKVQMILLNVAIHLRQGMSIMKRIIAFSTLPVIEGISMLFVFFNIQKIWGKYNFDNADYYESSPILFLICLYILIWLSVFAWNKMYSRPSAYSRTNIIPVTCLGAIIILVIYSLLPESSRTSRALIGFFTIWTILGAYFLRTILLFILSPSKRQKRIGFVGTDEHFHSFSSIVTSNFKDDVLVRQISPDEILNIDDIKHIDKLNEVVFSFKDLRLNEILKTMTSLDDIEFKIYGSDGLSAIGSRAKSIPGESYSERIEFAIADERNVSLKRLLDLTVGVVLLVLSPILSLFTRSTFGKLINRLGKVILGTYTLVGYNTIDSEAHVLPSLKPGLIEMGSTTLDQHSSHKHNAKYAMYYSIWKDLQIITKQWRSI